MSQSLRRLNVLAEDAHLTPSTYFQQLNHLKLHSKPPQAPAHTHIAHTHSLWYTYVHINLKVNPFIFLVSAITLCYLLTSEDLELGTVNERKHVVFVFLSLSYLNNLF